MRKILHAAYPEVFDYENPKPLAIGIDKKIRITLPQFSHKILNFFMVKWVRHLKYLKSLIASEQRIDLDNQPSFIISAEHKKIAQLCLDQKKLAASTKTKAKSEGNSAKA